MDTTVPYSNEYQMDGYSDTVSPGSYGEHGFEQDDNIDQPTSDTVEPPPTPPRFHELPLPSLDNLEKEEDGMYHCLDPNCVETRETKTELKV